MTKPLRPARLACLLAAGVGGCAPEVRLAVPPAVVSDQWQAPAPAATQPADGFWPAFGSPRLTELITRALGNNADVAAAAARIDRARGELRIARAALRPSGSASPGLSANRTHEDGARRFDYSQGFAGIDISYEVDLFGRLRAGRRAARARFEAAAFDRDAVALLTESEVARLYVRHATLVERIALLDRAITNARELVRIIGVRRREGAATEVDVGIGAIELRRLEAQRAGLVEAQARTRNALAVLVGEEAPRFALAGEDVSALRAPLPALVQPATLLVRRPDLRGAEARITAANGDVARVRAAFLPGLTLSASALGQAATLTGPFGATLSAGAGLVAPLLDRGRLKGQLAVASADQREAVERYRGALLIALAEVESALTAVEQARSRQQLLADASAQAQRTARLSRLQYVEGTADLQTIIEAERGLLNSEDELATARQDMLEACIDTYKAIGGAPAR